MLLCRTTERAIRALRLRRRRRAHQPPRPARRLLSGPRRARAELCAALTTHAHSRAPPALRRALLQPRRRRPALARRHLSSLHLHGCAAHVDSPSRPTVCSDGIQSVSDPVVCERLFPQKAPYYRGPACSVCSPLGALGVRLVARHFYTNSCSKNIESQKYRCIDSCRTRCTRQNRPVGKWAGAERPPKTKDGPLAV